MPYLPHTDADRKAMLAAIGATSVEELFRGIPPELRRRAPLELPPGLSEPELVRHMRELAARNRPLDGRAFLGAGCYRHFIPAVVEALVARGEFLTAYTPYQPEFSQGALQAFFEFQTMMCALTGMEVSNSSVYDGASAVAEAVLMAHAAQPRASRVLISRAVHPEARQVAATITRHLPIHPEEVPLAGGVTDLDAARRQLAAGGTAALVVQQPNFFGCLEDLTALIALAHEYDALAVVSSYPVALGLIEAPGAQGADIVVGDGGALGNAPAFGGPHLGFLTTRERLARKVPGRIVGQTADAEGRRGFALILQTREQHIRREKATSNICTNQGLNALRTTIHLAALGRAGFTRLARVCAARAHEVFRRVAGHAGLTPAFAAPFFNEFVLRGPQPARELLRLLWKKARISGGVDLGRWYPEFDGHLMLAVTELNTPPDLDLLVDTLLHAGARAVL